MPADGRVLVVTRPGEVSLAPARSEPELPDGRADVRTLYSGLSAGTDLSFVKSTHPSLHIGWDPELALFDGRRPEQGYPVRRWGYLQVAEVTASRDPA